MTLDGKVEEGVHITGVTGVTWVTGGVTCETGGVTCVPGGVTLLTYVTSGTNAEEARLESSIVSGGVVYEND